MAALGSVAYRLGQVRQQLGFVPPLTAKERAEVTTRLPASALPLFDTMSNADQQHSLRVCRGLLTLGCADADLLAAALLHDVGKAQGRVPFWTRPAIVVGKAYAPGLLHKLVLPFDLLLQQYNGEAQGTRVPRWRLALSYAWWHAELGATLAAAAGLSERAVLYIRTHHQPHGPAAPLHQVDEES
jgi:hypothetical protein